MEIPRVPHSLLLSLPNTEYPKAAFKPDSAPTQQLSCVVLNVAISQPISEKYVQIFSLQPNISEMSVKITWEKPKRRDFFTPPREERDGQGGGRRATRKTERKGGKKAVVNRGKRSEGRDGEGREGGGSAHADPFPRWTPWTISLPLAGPENHDMPRLSPLPALLSAGPPPRTLNARELRLHLF